MREEMSKKAKVLNMRTVQKFIDESNGNTTLLLGYTQAMMDYDPELKHLVKKAKSLDELQNLILGFCEKQEEFVNRAWIKYFP